MSSKSFHLSDILSVTHDRLFSTRHMEGVYEICNFLTQDKLFTHQLPRVHDECKAHLLTLHPQLNCREMDAAIADFILRYDAIPRERATTQAFISEWLAPLYVLFGEYLDVTPIPKGIHEYKDPVAEAEEMVGRKNVIRIDI